MRGTGGRIDVEASVERLRRQMYRRCWLTRGRTAVDQLTQSALRGLEIAAALEDP